MLASLFSKPQSSLSVQAKRLVAMRFLIYTGFQTSYFIGRHRNAHLCRRCLSRGDIAGRSVYERFVIWDPLRVALRSTHGVRAAISC